MKGDGPLFGERGDTLRISREAKRPPALGYYYFGFPAAFAVIVVVFAYHYNSLVAVTYAIIIFLGLWMLLFLYIHRNTRYQSTLEMDRTSVRLFERGELVSEVTFGPGALVDIYTNDSIKSEEYGPLWGYVFRDGGNEVSLSPRDGWELWDIQSMLGPVLRLTEHHRMQVGPDLDDYKSARGTGH